MTRQPQALALEIDLRASAILAEVGSWDFITEAGKQQVRKLCTVYQAATVSDLLSSPRNTDLPGLFESRLSDLRQLKPTIQEQITEAQDCEWLRMALAATDVDTTQTINGVPTSAGPLSMAN